MNICAWCGAIGGYHLAHCARPRGASAFMAKETLRERRVASQREVQRRIRRVRAMNRRRAVPRRLVVVVVGEEAR